MCVCLCVCVPDSLQITEGAICRGLRASIKRVLAGLEAKLLGAVMSLLAIYLLLQHVGDMTNTVAGPGVAGHK